MIATTRVLSVELEENALPILFHPSYAKRGSQRLDRWQFFQTATVAPGTNGAAGPLVVSFTFGA